MWFAEKKGSQMSRAEYKSSEAMRSLTMECMTYCSLLKQQAGLLTAALPVKERSHGMHPTLLGSEA